MQTFTAEAIHITRGGAVRKLVGLITRRSQVQILSPLFGERRHVSLSWDVAFFITLNFCICIKEIKKFFYLDGISPVSRINSEQEKPPVRRMHTDERRI